MNGATLTVVCDDFSGAEPGFATSYGFALLIEMQGKSILFDTGTRPEDLLANLRAHGTDAGDLDAVILSHNHYDHTDGLAGVLEQNPDIPVYVHRRWDDPHSHKSFVVPEKNRVTLDGATEHAHGLHITNCHHSDDYGGIHEQACRITTDSTQILITGCCHPGLDAYFEEIDPERPLQIIGGLHGFRFDDDRARMVSSRIERITCCHCTQNYDAFTAQFGSKCCRIPVGRTIQVS